MIYISPDKFLKTKVLPVDDKCFAWQVTHALPAEDTFPLETAGGPCPSSGGLDFFEKSLGAPALL